jgi:uracil-DNA glycosylase
LLDQQASYIRQEQDILKPKLVVAMGKGRGAMLQKILGSETRVEEIPHYAPQWQTKQQRVAFADRFVDRLAEIQSIYKSG